LIDALVQDTDLHLELGDGQAVLLPDLIGLGSVSARAAFVIDKDGVVQYSEQTPSPKELPNFNAIRDTLGKV
jgi:peroxiredoxin